MTANPLDKEHLSAEAASMRGLFTKSVVARVPIPAGTVLGTASYISPEQASGHPAGPASDVYSFGVILYRMLTGRLPFESTSAVDVLRDHVHGTPPPLSAVRPDAPPVLAALAAS